MLVPRVTQRFDPGRTELSSRTDLEVQGNSYPAGSWSLFSPAHFGPLRGWYPYRLSPVTRCPVHLTTISSFSWFSCVATAALRRSQVLCRRMQTS